MIGGFLDSRAVLANLKKIVGKWPDRVGDAMYQEGLIEMKEMRRRTPVDTTPNAPHPGQLRDSGKVEKPERIGRRIYVTLSFATDYAVFVHEDPDALHPVGQWKYMESVLNESRNHMAGRIARRVDLNKMRV